MVFFCRCIFCLTHLASPCSRDVWVKSKWSHPAPSRCSSCQVVFGGLNSIKSHIQTAHCEVFHKCPSCPMAFKSSPSAQNHISTQHPTLTGGQAKYVDVPCKGLPLFEIFERKPKFFLLLLQDDLQVCDVWYGFYPETLALHALWHPFSQAESACVQVSQLHQALRPERLHDGAHQGERLDQCALCHCLYVLPIHCSPQWMRCQKRHTSNLGSALAGFPSGDLVLSSIPRTELLCFYPPSSKAGVAGYSR